MFTPMSASRWWSVCRISTDKPRAAAPKSCAAWRAMTTTLGPPMSR
jgi:hypothetical protein